MSSGFACGDRACGDPGRLLLLELLLWFACSSNAAALLLSIASCGSTASATASDDAVTTATFCIDGRTECVLAIFFEVCTSVSVCKPWILALAAAFFFACSFCALVCG
jgi:hypothetical protein